MSTTATATYTWRDLVAGHGTLQSHELIDADRGHLNFTRSRAVRAATHSPTCGGLLLWNATQDYEQGHIVMLTGQTAEQERQVMDNAAWMISCGAAYSATRVGMGSYKSNPDHRLTIRGDRFLVWTLANDSDVYGTIRPATQAVAR